VGVRINKEWEEGGGGREEGGGGGGGGGEEEEEEEFVPGKVFVSWQLETHTEQNASMRLAACSVWNEIAELERIHSHSPAKAKAEVEAEAEANRGETQTTTTTSDNDLVLGDTKINASALQVIGLLAPGLSSVKSLLATLTSLQGTLTKLADGVDQIIHLITFADFAKSALAFFWLCLVVLFLSIVKTRYVLLGIELGVFLKVPVRRLVKLWGGGEAKAKVKTGGSGGNPVSNLLAMIPTLPDVTSHHHPEHSRREILRQNRKIHALRLAKLQHVFRVKWHSSNIMVLDDRLTEKEGKFAWRPAFAIMTGKKIEWWSSAMSFDGGEQRLDFVDMTGHCGFSGLSPLEVRRVGVGGSGGRKISVFFGRGKEGNQVKKLFLFGGGEEMNFKKIVEEAIGGSNERERER